MAGRYPKIGNEKQNNILSKIFYAPKHLSDYEDEHGEPFYYRTSGGEYFNIITPYATGSSQEKPFYVQKQFTKIIGATLSTSLFWFYQQIYCDGLHIKQSEIENVPIFDLESLTPAQIEQIEKIYDEYLADIEKNVTRSNFEEGSVYQQSGAKIYKLGRSKHLADALDDLIGVHYGLTSAQIEYLKGFELEFRLSD